MEQRREDRDVTALLARFRQGDRAAEAVLFPLVYEELHRIAARHMRRERAGHSLQPTALVNEAYVRLLGQRAQPWQNRAHFFALASGVMREILIDHARRRGAAKRGHGKPPIRLDESPMEAAPEAILTDDQLETLIAIDEALRQLTDLDPRQTRIVELRFFAGMSSREIAEVLEISERTVEREWASARAWLYTRLRSTA